MKKPVMPDPRKVLTTLRRAAMLCRGSKGRRNALIELDDSVVDIVVMGDLHGNLRAFRQLLERAALDRNPNRHMVLQELVHGKWLYPDDRGDKSHQLVDVVAALKCQYPDRVHVILGNHELSELTNRHIIKDGVPLNALFQTGIETAYGAAATEIVAAYHELFSALPLAVRTSNRVLMIHTIPESSDLDRMDESIFDRSGPWSSEDTARGGPIYAITWGRDTSPETVDRFAALVDVDWFVTGHIPCDEGFCLANHRQIILDGTDPYPTLTLFPARGPITLEMIAKGARILPLPT